MDSVIRILRANHNVVILNATVRLHPKLTDFQKLLFGEINQLADHFGVCQETDQYFADLYSKPISTVRRAIRALIALDFLFEVTEDGKRMMYSSSHGTAKELYEYNPEPTEATTNKDEGISNTASKTGFVYLMKDTKLGCYKIGFSKNPAYREKTLQAEKPTIELVFSAPATINIERDFHLQYGDKRIRGEWFNLNADDVHYITSFLSNP